MGLRLWDALTLQPSFETYLPNSALFWGKHAQGLPWILAIRFWNPIAFAAAIGFILYAANRGHLSATEVIVSLGLLIRPYILRAPDTGFAGHGRFASVVLTAYVGLAVGITNLG
jgi:hypothetical protein